MHFVTLEYLESVCSFKRKFKTKLKKIYPFFYYNLAISWLVWSNQLLRKAALSRFSWAGYPPNISLFKVNNKNTRKRCEIWTKLTIKTAERRPSPFSSVFIVDFEEINVSWIGIAVGKESERI